MEKLFDSLYEKIGPVATKIANQRHLAAIRDGIVLIMPITIVASLFIIIGELPIPAYQNLMMSIFGEEFWGSFVWDMVFPATLGITALIAALGVPYSLVDAEGVDGLPAAAISLASYFLLLDFNGNILDFLGTEGLFVALITGLIVGDIYLFFTKRDWVIKLPDSVPPTIIRSFVALIPGVVTIILFFAIKLLMMNTKYVTAHNLILTILQAPLMSLTSTFLGTLLSNLANSFLWTFGLHGDHIVGSITAPILKANFLANVEAVRNNLEPIYINVEGFEAIFLNFGGTGSILGLILAMRIGTKSKALKQLSDISLVPSLFNISEPIMFGLPVVLNPIMMIPFLLTTLAVSTLAYSSFALGFVNKIVVSPPWTTPIFISGYLATGGDLRAIILQAVLLFVSFSIYYPFIRIIDKDYLKKELD